VHQRDAPGHDDVLARLAYELSDVVLEASVVCGAVVHDDRDRRASSLCGEANRGLAEMHTILPRSALLRSDANDEEPLRGPEREVTEA
jgi:hypothetical protein